MVSPIPGEHFNFAPVANHCIFGCWIWVVGKMCSLESGFLLIGLPLARNGPIECAGHIIWWVGRNLRRAARSSLACEAASLAMVTDSAIWYRAVLMEFWLVIFDYAPSMKRGKLL